MPARRRTSEGDWQQVERQPPVDLQLARSLGKQGTGRSAWRSRGRSAVGVARKHDRDHRVGGEAGGIECERHHPAGRGGTSMRSPLYAGNTAQNAQAARLELQANAHEFKKAGTR